MPKFHKLQRGVCLALLVISSICSFFKPHLIPIAGLSLLGVIAYDVVCFFKEKTKVHDFGPEIAALKSRQDEIYQQVKEMKDDTSVAKLAHTFRKG